MKVVLEAEDYIGEVSDIAPISSVNLSDFTIPQQIATRVELITFKFGGKYKDLKNRRGPTKIHKESHPNL